MVVASLNAQKGQQSRLFIDVVNIHLTLLFVKFTNESVGFLAMAISISSSLSHISSIFAKLLFPVVSKDFPFVVHVQNLNKETVEGSIVKAGHLKNLDRIGSTAIT